MCDGKEHLSHFLSVAEQWRPRRSIIFGSWGAEEFGLIGSAEYTEVISTVMGNSCL